MKPVHCRRWSGLPSPRPSRGFALLLALTLLAFVTTLFVGLASLTKVELITVGTRQRHTQAREHARMSLTLAVAQLQQWAGPDQRVTATAEGLAGVAHPYWTGVWDASAGGKPAAAWLVSGAESAGGHPVPTTALGRSATVEVYRAGADADLGTVFAPLVAIRDEAGSSTVPAGHYAWWVGDEGVKASVAAPSAAEAEPEAYAEGAEQRARMRQALALTPGPAALDPASSFEPRDEQNGPLVNDARFLSFEQLAYLRSSDGATLGRDPVARHAAAWTPNSQNVLADSRHGGLRQDLSLQPELLGRAFAAWMDYESYLEQPGAAVDPWHTMLPAYGPDPLRRRHRIVAPVRDAGVVFTTAPVLSSFFLQFNVRRVGGNSAPAATHAIEVRARLVVQLWNPWTTALVPEPLRLAVSGLPELTLVDSNGGRQGIALSQCLGAPMIIHLTDTDVAFPGDADDHSWLPGRVYAWRTHGGAVGAWDTEFYNRTLSVSNANLWVVPANISYAPPATNGVLLSVSGPAAQLTLELQQADGTTLATIRSPNYAAFSTTPQKANNNDEYRFGFALRLIDPVDFAADPTQSSWLVRDAGDPRSLLTGEPLYRAGSGGDLPSAYVGVGGNAVLTDENRLLDRVMGRTGMSYNEDAPVFELPRQPVLSLGQLQHLQIEGARPFAVGNPWSAPQSINGIAAPELFDRFFLSGLRSASRAGSPASPLILPAPLLRPIPVNPATGAAPTSEELRAASSARSSAFLLQSGAFNINSVSVDAWTAVLRACRVIPGESFSYLEPSASSGSAGDDALGKDESPGATFFRFSQSAQETYRADAGYAASASVPPSAPTVPSAANTHLYRRGRRRLSDAQISAFAAAVVAANLVHQQAEGPWRSLADFVSPQVCFGGASVLEHAIAAAALNAAVAEFSSQWLTPADVLTSLAPLLFARSDTFRVRAYGDATNPATGAVESRVWCEAVVQRMPAYVEPASDSATALPDELTSAVNRRLGRRFQIVSFRWLNRTDL